MREAMALFDKANNIWKFRGELQEVDFKGINWEDWLIDFIKGLEGLPSNNNLALGKIFQRG